jgi:hypothetical protein
VAHLICAIREAEGLTDVHILFDGGIYERGVDDKLTEFEVHGGYSGKEEPDGGAIRMTGAKVSV